MIARNEGAIVTVSSMWGRVGASCEVAYSASKAAVIGLTRALAKELEPSGVRVNCIAPGVIDTRMMDEHSDETRPRWRKKRRSAVSARRRTWRAPVRFCSRTRPPSSRGRF